MVLWEALTASTTPSPHHVARLSIPIKARSNLSKNTCTILRKVKMISTKENFPKKTHH